MSIVFPKSKEFKNGHVIQKVPNKLTIFSVGLANFQLKEKARFQLAIKDDFVEAKSFRSLFIGEENLLYASL